MGKTRRTYRNFHWTKSSPRRHSTRDASSPAYSKNASIAIPGTHPTSVCNPIPGRWRVGVVRPTARFYTRRPRRCRAIVATLPRTENPYDGLAMPIVDRFRHRLSHNWCGTRSAAGRLAIVGHQPIRSCYRGGHTGCSSDADWQRRSTCCYAATCCHDSAAHADHLTATHACSRHQGRRDTAARPWSSLEGVRHPPLHVPGARHRQTRTTRGRLDTSRNWLRSLAHTTAGHLERQ